MEFKTKRLELKRYTLKNIDDYCRLKSESLVWKYSTQKVISDRDVAVKQLNDLLNKYNQTDYLFHALYLKESMTYIGEAGIIAFNERNKRAVIGYNLLPEYWGRGLASEIVIGLVNNLFEAREVERIEGLVVYDNIASRKVLENSGFKLEGVLRNFTFLDGLYRDVCYYGIISSDRYLRSR